MTAAATISDVRSSAAPRAAIRAIWSAPTWRATCHLITGSVIGLVSLVVVPPLLVVTLVLTPTVVGAAFTMSILLILNRGLTTLQRSRFAALLQVRIRRAPASTGPAVRRFARAPADRDTWRQLGYHIFASVFGVVAGVMVAGVWSAGLVLTPAVVFAAAVPAVGAAPAAGLTLTGIVMLFVAPWTARVLAALDAAIGQALLGADSTEELSQRVTALAASREGAVDAADAERRRIERDLHDGVQQRLTSLAVNLGVARTTMTDGAPAHVREVIAQAHDEAKQALTELRDLVRGMHPAVLDARGLDAALSGIAARCPLPVRLDVNVPDRAAPEIEAVAYFVVAEALTNATAHAGASQIDVSIERHRHHVRVTVTDDGRGGADPGRGSGLTGLAGRVRSVDGSFQVDSPAGGPTTVIAELPCAL